MLNQLDTCHFLIVPCVLSWHGLLTWFVDVPVSWFRGYLLQRLKFLWSLISRSAKLWNGVFVDVPVSGFQGSLLQRLKFLWSLISRSAKLRNGVFVDVPISGFRHFAFRNFGTHVMKSLDSWLLQLSVPETLKHHGFSFREFIILVMIFHDTSNS